MLSRGHNELSKSFSTHNILDVFKLPGQYIVMKRHHYVNSVLKSHPWIELILIPPKIADFVIKTTSDKPSYNDHNIILCHFKKSLLVF